MISRRIAPVIEDSSRQFPVVTILGPRQSGKTTLVRSLFPDHCYLNFENPETRTLFTEDPKSLLRYGSERLIIDEAQREPESLSWVQVYADRNRSAGQFILTGSNQPLLGEAISQSLAGRTSVHYLLPLSMEELRHGGLLAGRDKLLFQGCLPRLYDDGLQPGELYRSYFATYVERDVRRLINVRDLGRFETFLRLLAGRAGRLLNLSSISSDVGVSSTTLESWLSALEASFVVVRLRPYHANLGKRYVKTPKVYFTEPGLLAWLLQIERPGQVARDPLLGEMFENLVVVEAMKAAYNRGVEPRLTFYRDNSGLEIDLIREEQRRPFAIEIKAAATFLPDMLRNLERFRSLEIDLAGTGLVYSGDERRSVRDVTVVNHADVATLLFEGDGAAGR